MKTAIRIPCTRYVKDEAFNNHIEYIKQYSDIIDEVALFTEYSHHGYWEKEYITNLAQILKKRIVSYKNAGIKSVGLNVLITLGHLDEAWDVLPKPPMPTMVGINGEISTSNLCPNSPEFRKYIAYKYKTLAGVNPDFIWIDDDFRIENHGPAGPCFCNKCISYFNNIYDYCETFETLTLSIKSNPDSNISRNWKEFCVRSLTEVAEIIENSIHSVNPDIIIGKMTGFGDTYTEWLKALKAQKLRPGGGFYNDYCPEWAEVKFLTCENQNYLYSENINDIQYEVENFPHLGMGKSQTITKLECMYALMSGCNGIAYNILSYVDDKKTLDTARAVKDIYNAITMRAPYMLNCGIYCVDAYNTAYNYMRIGLPITADKRNASAFIILGCDVNSYTHDEIIKILSGAVLLDNDALDTLVKKGYGEYIGVKSLNYYTNGIMEKFTNSEINGNYKGFIRNAWVSFDGQKVPMATLEITNNNVEVISDMYTVSEQNLGPCMTVFKNKLGGCVAVSTYMCAHHIQCVEKRQQLLNLFDYMIPEGLPVKINIGHKIVPVLKENGDGYILMLSNMSHDNTGEFTVDIKYGNCKILNTNGSLSSINSKEYNGKTRLVIDNIKPFDAVIITDK